MKRIAVILACVGALAASAAARPVSNPVVRSNGQVGLFRIDVTTEAQLLALEGDPAKVENDFSPPSTKPIGHTLYYRCGRGCETAYAINNATGKLSDFQTSSPRFVTERGSHVGMRVTEASRRERHKPVPGCATGPYIHIRSDDHHEFVLTGWGGKIDQIIYLGPHSVYYDGLC